MKGTNIFLGELDLKERGTAIESSIQKGRWVYARPVGYISFWHTLKCAWKVLTHKADIVVWNEPGNNY
ncbi:MAG: hypothetical protein WC648_01150 [Candidatus Paceibacterota bacterium]|jgi:hypothetical protein